MLHNFLSKGYSVLDITVTPRICCDSDCYVTAGCEEETKNTSYQREMIYLLCFVAFVSNIANLQSIVVAIELN